MIRKQIYLFSPAPTTLFLSQQPLQPTFRTLDRASTYIADDLLLYFLSGPS
jgi:hypothetical protein